LTASERDKYEEKARERAREQEVNRQKKQTRKEDNIYKHTFQINSAPAPQVTNNNTTTNFDSHNMPVINPQRMVNGGVTINGHYQTNPNMQSMFIQKRFFMME
jgi:hypothetical protein